MIVFHSKEQYDIVKGGIAKPLVVIASQKPGEYHRLFCLWSGGVWLRLRGNKIFCRTWGAPPNGARDHSEARLSESKNELLCIKCGKRKRYERNGRVFALCAVCGWNNIQEFLDLPDRPAELRNEAEAVGQDLTCTCDKVKFYPWENVTNEDCPIHGVKS